MCRVIAVSNQKGGVGKTVSCVNLGIGLVQEGKKVLLIDADPQGSLTISLGYEEPDEMEYALKRTAGRPTKENACHNGTHLRSDQELALQVGDSARSIQRYVRIRRTGICRTYQR